MFNKINFTFLLLGIIILLFEFNRLYLKIYINTEDYRIGTRPSFFYDGYLGFILISIEIFLTLCIISYSLSLNNKLSKIGKVIIDLMIKVFNKVSKK